MGGLKVAELTIVETTDTLTRVKLEGRLDTAGVDEVEVKFNAKVCPAGKDTLVDVSGVTFLASMGIRMLISAARTLSRHSARMVLIGPQALVRESIGHAGLDALIQIVDDDHQALDLLGN
jgi:anti-anti-sigma factor